MAQATGSCQETIIVDDTPAPDYPRYRVRPGEPIVLADVDPDTSERYKKKKHVEEELEHQRDRLGNYKHVCMRRTSTAC